MTNRAPLKLLATLSALALCAAAGPALAAPAPAACPLAAEQLPELLASAKQRVGHDGEVLAEFDVDGDGQVSRIRVDGDRIYRTPTRIALDSMECHGGTPQHYILRIRFADAGDAATAAVTTASASSIAPPTAPLAASDAR
jgi:hypothetical protein